MAFKGNGVNSMWKTGAITAPTRYSYHFHYQNDSTPATGSYSQPFTIANATSSPTYDCGFSWDHVDVNFRKAIYHRESGGTYRAAVIGSVSANTWYRIGGRYDGSNLDSFHDGSLITSTGCADPSTANNPTIGLMSGGGGSTGFLNDDGPIAEVGVWNVALTDAEFAALGNGVSPLLIRPGSLVLYNRCVAGDRSDLNTSRSSTGFNFSSVAHPPLILWAGNDTGDALQATVTSQDVTAPTISSGSALYAPSVAAVVALPTIASGSTLAAPTLAGGVSLPTISDTVLYTPSPAAAVDLPTISSGSTLAAPTVAAEIDLPTIASGSTLHAPLSVSQATTPMSVTQAALEVFGTRTAAAHVTQSDLEVFGLKVAPADVSQAVLEVFGLPLLLPPAVACLDVDGLIGYPYFAAFLVTDGRAPFTFAITAGSLPPGLTLDAATGVVSGTPTTAGTYSYTVQVTDDLGQIGLATCGLVVTELPPPPLEYEEPCQIQTPRVWACLQDAAGVVRANVALRAAMRDAPDFLGGYKPPRLLSAGVVNRTAADWLTRNWSAQTCDISLADTDFGIASLAGLSSQQRSQFYLYLTSDANRRLEALPRLLFQGPIYSDETSDLQRRVTANDILGVEYDIFAGGVQIPKRTVTAADFPAATTGGQAVPIIGGHVTDAEFTFNGGADAGNPEWGHGNIRLSYGAVAGIDVGALTVNGITKRAVLFAGHALKNYDHLYLFNQNAFGPVVFQDGLLTNNGIAEAQYGVSVWVPGKPGYTSFNPSGLPFVDINGRRYSIVFVNDAVAAQLDNGFELRANVQGAEDVGDGSGDLIEDAPTLCEWMFLNWLIGDYQSGAWLTTPQFEFYPGSGILIDRVNHAGFQKATAIGTTLVVGGLKGSFVVGPKGQQISSTEVIANMLRSWNLMLRWNQFNQLEVVMLDRRRDVFLDSTKGVTWKADILTSPRFKAAVKSEWFANFVTGSWGMFWVDYPFWNMPVGTPTDAFDVHDGASEVQYGVVRHILRLDYVLDHATGRAVTNQYHAFSSVPRFVATWAQSLCALRYDVLDGALVTHYAGPAEGGWNRQALWILAQRINAAAATVEIDAVNIDDLLT